jgi:cytochrome c
MKALGVVVVILALAVGLAPPAAAQQAGRGTAEEAQALVARAIDLSERLSIDVSLAALNAQDPRFIDRDLYVFVLDADGIVVAQSADPSRVGLDARELIDAEGNPIGTWLIERATPEGVWIDYLRQDPASGKNEAKSSWVVRQGDYIYGCSIYKAP